MDHRGSWTVSAGPVPAGGRDLGSHGAQLQPSGPWPCRPILGPHLCRRSASSNPQGMELSRLHSDSLHPWRLGLARMSTLATSFFAAAWQTLGAD